MYDHPNTQVHVPCTENKFSCHIFYKCSKRRKKETAREKHLVHTNLASIIKIQLVPNLVLVHKNIKLPLCLIV
jgi:hypothetical protein